MTCHWRWLYGWYTHMGEAHMAVNAFWTLAVPRLVNTVTGVPHRGLE